MAALGKQAWRNSVYPKKFVAAFVNWNYLLLLVVDRHKLTLFYLKSFGMDSVQVGKAVFVKENYATMGIEPKTFSNTGSFGNRTSVCWVKNFNGLLKQFNM